MQSIMKMDVSTNFVLKSFQEYVEHLIDAGIYNKHVYALYKTQYVQHGATQEQKTIANYGLIGEVRAFVKSAGTAVLSHTAAELYSAFLLKMEKHGFIITHDEL